MANRNFTVRVVNPNNINLSALQLLAEANTAELSSVRDEMSEMLESIDTELNWRNKIQPTLDGAKAHEVQAAYRTLRNFRANGATEQGFRTYATLWGCDPSYDRSPNLKGDGNMFYRFGNIDAANDKAFLKDFTGAIERTLTAIDIKPHAFQPEDKSMLTDLLGHVKELLATGEKSSAK